MDIFARSVQKRSDDFSTLAEPADWLFAALGSMGTDSGMSVSPHNALKYSGVYACINVIAQTIAQVPWDVFRKDGKNRIVATDRPEHYLLHSEPMPTMTSFNLRISFLVNALLSGNGYIEILRDGSNRIRGFRPLKWWTVSVYESLDETKLVFKVTRRNGQVENLDSSDVVHIPCMSIDGIAGLSPIAQARQGIGLGLAAEAAGAAFFGNGSRPSGYLSTPKPLRKDEREDLEKKWYQRFSGSKNTGKVPVLSGDVKWNALSIPPSDAQYIETRIHQLADIARIYRVPAVLIGLADKTSTYASADAFFLAFVKFTITPWVTAIEQEFNRKLFPGRDDLYCKLDLNGLLRGDAKGRAEFYKNLWTVGALSENEIRDWEELDPIEGGDRYFIQQGFVPLDKVDQVLDKQGTTGTPKQDPQAGGTDNLSPARSAHTNWLGDVLTRVAKWERRDDARLAEAILPVFRSYSAEAGLEHEDLNRFCVAIAQRLGIAPPGPGPGPEQLLTLFEIEAKHASER